MSSLRYSISKSIPRKVSVEQATSYLHNPLNLITISPVVVEYHQVEPPKGVTAEADTKYYKLADSISYLPFGLWTGSKTVDVSYTNQHDGVTVVKHAPFGFTFHETWTVRDASKLKNTNVVGNGGTEPQMELNVDVEMSGSTVGVMAFKGYMQKNHQNYVDKIVSGMSI